MPLRYIIGWTLMIALTSGCVLVKPQGDGQDGDGDGGSDGVSSTGGGSSPTSSASGAPTEAGGGEGGATGTGSGEGGATATGGTATGGTGSSGGDEGLPDACATADHATCFAAIVDACKGEGNWGVSQACVDAVAACYPLGTDVLAPADIVEFCSAEFDAGCLSKRSPGCGETFCACTAGAFPFDWDDCWHLTLVGCHDSAQSDCQAVLDGCYPGHTPEQYGVCFGQVLQAVGFECDCPMCGIHEQCEVALDACLGG